MCAALIILGRKNNRNTTTSNTIMIGPPTDSAAPNDQPIRTTSRTPSSHGACWALCYTATHLGRVYRLNVEEAGAKNRALFGPMIRLLFNKTPSIVVRAGTCSIFILSLHFHDWFATGGPFTYHRRVSRCAGRVQGHLSFRSEPCEKGIFGALRRAF